MKMTNPLYPNEPISNLDSLAKALGIEVQQLTLLYQNSDDYFFQVKEIQKSDGTTRITYDTKTELKHIHEKISTRILKKVLFPDYLNGSIKGKSYLDNVETHTAKKVIISEDITNFFPSISKKVIYQIWVGFFNFSHEVAECLSELVTYKGFMVQGAKTSSHLANLVLWSRETNIVTFCQSKGCTYTRYVDDITVSSSKILTQKTKTEIISRIHSLCSSISVKVNRKKHKIMPRNQRQTVHQINCNSTQPSIPKAERARIKTAVFQCEELYLKKSNSQIHKKSYRSAVGRVNRLKNLHPKQYKKLAIRLRKIKPTS